MLILIKLIYTIFYFNFTFRGIHRIKFKNYIVYIFHNIMNVHSYNPLFRVLNTFNICKLQLS